MRPNVLQALPSKENDTTNLLKALCVLTQFREVVLRHFTGGKFGAEAVDPGGIKTQQDIGGCIPDMVLEGTDVIVVVEVKTTEWCGLTDNQPQEYLKWLHDSLHKGAKYFVLLVPPDYQHQHRTEYVRRKKDFMAAHGDCGIVFSALFKDRVDTLTRIVDSDTHGLLKLTEVSHDRGGIPVAARLARRVDHGASHNVTPGASAA